jgi:hypothetical protein
MNLLRVKWVAGMLSVLLAFHFFNVSVDPQNSDADCLSEKLSINEMESVAEIICEQMLHIDNAFPEHRHHKSHNSDKSTPAALHLTLAFWHQPLSGGLFTPCRTLNSLYISQNENFFQQYSLDILTPPPKA